MAPVTPGAVYLDGLDPLQAPDRVGELGRNGSLGYEGKRVVVQGRCAPTRSARTRRPASCSTSAGGTARSVGARWRSTTTCRPGGRTPTLRRSPTGARWRSRPSSSQARGLARSPRASPACSSSSSASRRAAGSTATRSGSTRGSRGARPTRRRASSWTRSRGPRSPCRRSAPGRAAASRRSDPAGYEPLLDDLLGSLRANGECRDALLGIFALGPSAGCARLAAKYQALLIPCEPRAPLNPMSKALLYSVAQVVDADQFLCLDADMLVLGSLEPVFAALEACPEGSILAVREGTAGGCGTSATPCRACTEARTATASAFWIARGPRRPMSSW